MGVRRLSRFFRRESHPTITLSGDAHGSATLSNLEDATLSITVTDDSHTHDTRYYSETEVDGFLATKSATGHTHSYLPLSGGTVTGTLDVSGYSQTSNIVIDRSGTTLSTPAVDVNNSGGAGDYNYFLRASNDVGTRAVMFVNGSTRTADGGTNVMTIRNDGGGSRFGNSSYATTIAGSAITLENTATATNFSVGTGSSANAFIGGSNYWRPQDAYGNSYFDINSGQFYVDSDTYYFRNRASGNSLVIDSAGNGTFTGSVTGQAFYASNWFRTYGEEGLYSESYGQHFYPDSGGFYWDSDGPIRIRSGHEGAIQGYLGYHDTNGFGLLHNGGDWWLNTQNNSAHLTIGGAQHRNAYNSVTGRRLMFGGGDADAQGNYYIGTNMENYGGNYNKLDIFWHTGVRIAAMTNYGGIRMYGTISGGSVSSELFSVGKGDSNVRVSNRLYTNSLETTSYSVSAPRYDTSFYVMQSQHWYGHSSSQTMYLGESGNSVEVRGTLTGSGSINKSGYVSVSQRVETSQGMVVYGGVAQSSINNTYATHSSIQLATDTYWGGCNTLHTGFLIASGGMCGWGTSQLYFRGSNNWSSYYSSSALRLQGTKAYFTMGPETTYDVYSDGAGRIGYYGSRRELKNIVGYVLPEQSLARIKQLRPVDFTWKKEHRPSGDNTELIDFDVYRGFIAEEVADVDRTLATWGWLYKEGDSDEAKVGDALTEELSRLDKTVDDAEVVSYDQRAIIADLVGSVQALEARIAELEAV